MNCSPALTEIPDGEILYRYCNPKNPKRTGQIVKEWHQDIIHSPVTEEDDPVHGANDAHSLIRGLKRSAILEAIRDNTQILLTPHTEADSIRV